MQLRWFLAISRMRFVSPPFIEERPFFSLTITLYYTFPGSQLNLSDMLACS